MLTNLAPIILFVFARPEHTKRTLDALAANRLAAQSDLFVYADAARNQNEVERVHAVRSLIYATSGFRSVTIIERETNYGLARNIVEGVTDVCNRYGRAIVLEDDLVTSPYFIEYMNNALEKYADEASVMHISGYIFPIDAKGLPQTFFLRTTSCWGWATWKRAWELFDKKPGDLRQRFTPNLKYAFNFENATNFWDQVELNLSGKIDTWAIFWYASVFLNNGLCLHPSQSLVQNIGHDGSGVHCGTTNQYDVSLPIISITEFAEDLSEHKIAFERVKKFFNAQKMSFTRRLLRKLNSKYLQSFTTSKSL